MIHRDDTRGHFVLDLPGGHLVAADLGGHLDLDASPLGRAHLTPDDARALADALTWWADRDRGTARGEDAVVEVGDLLELLEEGA